MGSRGEMQEHTHKFNLGLPLPQTELCFHRDQSSCVSRMVFLGPAVQLVEGLASLIGEQIVTGFHFSQNVFCLFLSRSFLFLCHLVSLSLPPTYLCLLFLSSVSLSV